METAKLFMNGRSQAVRLPKEFRFEGQQVYIKRMGQLVILLPHDDLWQTFFDSWELFSDDFMPTREQPAPQQRESL